METADNKPAELSQELKYLSSCVSAEIEYKSLYEIDKQLADGKFCILSEFGDMASNEQLSCQTFMQRQAEGMIYGADINLPAATEQQADVYYQFYRNLLGEQTAVEQDRQDLYIYKTPDTGEVYQAEIIRVPEGSRVDLQLTALQIDDEQRRYDLNWLEASFEQAAKIMDGVTKQTMLYIAALAESDDSLLQKQKRKFYLPTTDPGKLSDAENLNALEAIASRAIVKSEFKTRSSFERSKYLQELEDFPEFNQFAGLDKEIEQLKLANEEANLPDEVLQSYCGLERKNGILLQGPAGVGKTGLVKALARFTEAEYQMLSPSDIHDSLVGKSGRNLAELFKNAAAKDHKIILFFDEFDGLFSKRAGGNEGAAQTLVNEFKLRLNEVRQQPNVTVVAAANSLNNIDEALIRPGRFDSVVKIPKPNLQARVDIFAQRISANQQHFEIDQINNEAVGVTDLTETMPRLAIDLNQLALQTEDMTGADIEAITNDLLMQKALAEHRTAQPQPPITYQQLAQAVDNYKKSRPSDI